MNVNASANANAYCTFELVEKPLVDKERLKESFHQLSKTLRTDGSAADSSESTRWHQLNESYHILDDDVRRIKHLLELSGVRDVHASSAVPEEVMGLFATVGPILHRADETITLIDEAQSALEKAMIQEEVMTLAVELQKIAVQVGQYRFRVLNEIEQLDATWQDDPQHGALKQLYQQLIYIARWANQLDEKQFRIMSF